MYCRKKLVFRSVVPPVLLMLFIVNGIPFYFAKNLSVYLAEISVFDLEIFSVTEYFHSGRLLYKGLFFKLEPLLLFGTTVVAMSALN